VQCGALLLARWVLNGGVIDRNAVALPALAPPAPHVCRCGCSPREGLAAAVRGVTGVRGCCVLHGNFDWNLPVCDACSCHASHDCTGLGYVGGGALADEDRLRQIEAVVREERNMRISADTEVEALLARQERLEYSLSSMQAEEAGHGARAAAVRTPPNHSHLAPTLLVAENYLRPCAIGGYGDHG
jgi:hypothetical protein